MPYQPSKSLIDQVFFDVLNQFVVVYLDDILLYSRSL